ncbi:Ras-specific guanine nucleotide-releasing factor RalGPS1 [Dissostichus eleginoides]|nr:Ras-specific guanine nucleotide-releasing factor RalGPS1 [Dissostichus eleginoides]
MPKLPLSCPLSGVVKGRAGFAAAEDDEWSRSLELDGVGMMNLPNGQSIITTTAASLSEKSSSSESLSDQGSSDLKKSFDAVVFDVLKVTPEEYAGQITLMDAPVFKAIQPEELSSCGWNKKEKHSSSPNVVAFTRRFNQTSFWVVREILHAQTLKIRAEVLSLYIRTAKKLCDMNNLHAVMAVVSALQSAPIFRLTKTWALLSRKDKATFDRLDYLMSKEDNYKRLRDFISSQSMVSCIPYLGLADIAPSCLRSPQGQPVKCSDELVPVLWPIMQRQRAQRNVWLHCYKTHTLKFTSHVVKATQQEQQQIGRTAVHQVFLQSTQPQNTIAQ